MIRKTTPIPLFVPTWTEFIMEASAVTEAPTAGLVVDRKSILRNMVFMRTSDDARDITGLLLAVDGGTIS